MEIFLVVAMGLLVIGLGVAAGAAAAVRRDVARLRADAATVASQARPIDPGRAAQGNSTHR